jgi:ankyrin repeat protein
MKRFIRILCATLALLSGIIFDGSYVWAMKRKADGSMGSPSKSPHKENHNSVDVNIDNNSNEALINAIRAERPDLGHIQQLLDADADINFHDPRFNGQTPLMQAIICHHVHVVEFLINYVIAATTHNTFKTIDDLPTSLVTLDENTLLAEPFQNLPSILTIVEEEDNSGDTVFHIAAQLNNAFLLQYLVEFYVNIKNISKLIISAALKVATTEWQQCPLELFDQCFKPYLDLDYNYINKRNNQGFTPLMYAAQCSRHTLWDYMDTLGINILDMNEHANRIDIYTTACHHAEMVGFLLNHGADKSLRNNAGQTAYDLATDATVQSLLQQHMQQEAIV